MSEEKNDIGKKKHRGKIGIGLWVMVGVLATVAVTYLIGANADPTRIFRPDVLWAKMGRPILRTMIFISAGLLVGQLVESLGWTTRLGRLVWPLIRWARLPGAAGAAFTSAFVSGVVANTMLLTGWQEGRLTKRSLILANLLNASIPAYVLHMPTTMFVIISLVGKAGAIYVILTFAAALLRLIGVAALSRFIMPVCDACAYESVAKNRKWSEAWTETWPKFRDRLKRIIVIVIPVYFVVVLASESGFFIWLRNSLAGWVTGSLVSIEAMSVIIFAVVAEFTSGFAAAGALLQSGALGVKEVVLALLIGNVVATPVRALRHQLPHYMGIYSPALGAELLAIGQGIRILSVILVGVVFVIFY